MCVLSEFRHFLNSENSSKYFKVSSADLCKNILIVRDVLKSKSAFARKSVLVF